MIFDPVADTQEAKTLYDIDFADIQELNHLDAVIFAVSHNDFKKYLPLNSWTECLGPAGKSSWILRGFLTEKSAKTGNICIGDYKWDMKI